MTGRDDMHLDPATIAALVDGTLDPAARAAAEAHLAACADCREVWVETSEILSASHGVTGAPRVTSRRWIYGAAGLAAAAAIAVAVLSPALFNRGDRPELRELVEAVGTNRRTEGRLTGGFQWGPVPSVTRGPSSDQAPAVERAIAQATRGRPKTTDPKIIAASGIGALVTGQVDNAIEELTGALRIDDRNAFVWSDLASAYVERARLTGKAAPAADALRAADRALTLSPDLPEARFNRALALSYLDRRDEARAAWTAYLQRDSNSPWADEARARLGVQQQGR